MQERKTLTLNECLELERPLTLQEAVDLPLDTYKKYLYHRGILRHLPENLEDYVYDGGNDYNPEDDYVLKLKNISYVKTIDEDLSDEEWSEEDEIEYQKIEKQLQESSEYNEPVTFEYGIVNIHGKDINYRMCDAGGIGVYKIEPDGSMLIYDAGFSYCFR